MERSGEGARAGNRTQAQGQESSSAPHPLEARKAGRKEARGEREGERERGRESERECEREREGERD